MHGSILPVTIPPPAHPRGLAIFFLLGGLFPTPGHTERDNSPPPGLLIDHKYVVFVFKIDFRTIAQPDVLKKFTERRILHIIKKHGHYIEKEN